MLIFIAMNDILMKYDVQKDHYKYGLPFIYYKNSDLYVEDYIMPLEHYCYVMRAMEQYTSPSINENAYYYKCICNIDELVNDPYEMFFINFTYQAIGGDLIMWQLIDLMWANSRCRIGEHYCKCGTKTKMYYSPWCPACGDVLDDENVVNLIKLAMRLEYKTGTDYQQYIDAFRDACDRYRNDTIIEFKMPKANSVYQVLDKFHRENKMERLLEMNELFNFDKYRVAISW